MTALRDRLGGLADRFYGMPSSRLTVAGVTGTNGKTTCAWLLASAAGRLARRGAYLGTLGAGFPPAVDGGALTTPDVITLHRQLRTLADAGATHVAMEVSSHALDQRRVDAVRLRVAAFSNLSRDHLDYHGTMERYAEAKARLFRLPGLEHAVINVGDPVGARFAAALPAGVELTAVAVGGAAPAAARFVHVAQDPGRGPRPRARHPRPLRRAAPPLAPDRRFQRREPRGHARRPARRGSSTWTRRSRRSPTAARRPGAWRATACRTARSRSSTTRTRPDALAKALAAVRAHARGRVLVVFGCGGERDPGKRALMGEAAERLADRVIVTDDNPRGEDADRIVAMILEGMREPRQALVERDRARAIDAALAEARPGDAVLVAGKGHEDYQIVGRERRAFSDRERLRARARGAA